VDQRSIEDLFERNADMRLLELRHNEPGKGAPPNKRQASSFGAESIVSTTPDVETEKAPQLRVAIAAAPATGVIPGAVVGVAIDVFNDGSAPAPESKLLLSIPIETEYRSGSLRIDGREPQAPEQLFNQGLPVPRLPGGTSSKVTFQLAILPGVNMLYLQPRLQADGVPVVGTAGMSIKRNSGGANAQPVEAPRPFYELDDEETAEVAAQSAAPEMPPVLPPTVTLSAVEAPPPIAAPIAPQVAIPEPVIEATIVEPVAPHAAAPAPAPMTLPLAPEPEPLPELEPAPQLEAQPKTAAPKRMRKPTPTPEPEPEPAPKPKPVKAKAATASEERMARYRTLGNNDIALLDRLFSVDVPGLIAHHVLISSIACSEPTSGDDSGGYGAFLRTDIELLGRALVHSRMGKATQYRIVQSDLDTLALSWEAAPPPSFPAPRRLRRNLRRTEWAAVGGLMQPSERDATLRARIALLALAGETIEGVDSRTADECTAALAAYRSSVLAWLVPLCVASAGSDAYVIPAPPAGVDAAGRKLVAVLKLAITS
jgi:hypothetical protein